MYSILIDIRVLSPFVFSLSAGSLPLLPHVASETILRSPTMLRSKQVGSLSLLPRVAPETILWSPTMLMSKRVGSLPLQSRRRCLLLFPWCLSLSHWAVCLSLPSLTSVPSLFVATFPFLGGHSPYSAGTICSPTTQCPLVSWR